MRAPFALLLLAPALGVLAPTTADAATTTHYCHGKVATIVGTDGNDRLKGQNPLGDVVWLGPGNDTFTGIGGNDTICGGTGRDRISGGAGDDWINGGGNKDVLMGGAGDDTVFGSSGNDLIYADRGNDTIYGGGGTKDTLTYVQSTDPVAVDGATGTVQAGTDGDDTYTGVERVNGSLLADTMAGGSENDWFDGLKGHDTITGGGGDDVLRGRGASIDGGDGNDAIRSVAGTAHGGLGDDALQLSHHAVGYGDAGQDLLYLGAGVVTAYGGADVDTFAVRAVKDAATISGGAGSAVLTFQGFKRAVTVRLDRGTASWQGGSLHLTGIHVVRGSAHDDQLTGSNAPDQLYGGRGADHLAGLGGNDLLVGGSGRDVAVGGAGGDVCVAEVRRSCEA